MAEDWRLRVRAEAESQARELVARLSEPTLEHDLNDSFHDRVVVSRDDVAVFCYANSRAQADAAARAIETLARDQGWSLELALERWHPTAERWEPPDEPLPRTGEELAKEHAELIESERDESREQGFPMFEVRVSCESRADAEGLAQKLSAEGITAVHRWQFVVAGADDEDSADALAARIRAQAPPGSSVTVEGSIQEIAQEAPYGTPFSPFAIFGGLGG